MPTIKISQAQLNRERAKNIVRFKSFEDNERQSVCLVTVNESVAVVKYALKGMEEEVLEEMVYNFFNSKNAIGIN